MWDSSDNETTSGGVAVAKLDGELEAALPTVAHWRLATLPRSLTEQQVLGSGVAASSLP